MLSRKIAIIALLIPLAGCANSGPNQTIGALGGAGVGGFLGSMIGGGPGMLAATAAGTLIGAMAGGAVGQSMDAQNQTKYQSSRPYNSGEESAYNRGRADYEAEQQRIREQRAYEMGRAGR